MTGITYKITGRGESNNNNHYTFYLNGGGGFNANKHYPFCSGDVGDEIQVNTNKIPDRYNRYKIFDFHDSAACFVSSHGEGKYQEMERKCWRVEEERDTSERGREIGERKAEEEKEEKNEGIKKHKIIKEELEKLKTEYKTLREKLEGINDERLKEVKQSAQDLAIQKEEEHKIRVKQARNETELAALQKQEIELREEARSGKEAAKKLEMSRYENREAQAERRQLLAKESESKGTELKKFAVKLGINLTLIAKIKNLNKELAEAKESSDKRRLSEKIADEQQQLIDDKNKTLDFDDIEKIFNQCKEIAESEMKIDEISKNLERQRIEQHEELNELKALKALQEVKLLEHNK